MFWDMLTYQNLRNYIIEKMTMYSPSKSSSWLMSSLPQDHRFMQMAMLEPSLFKTKINDSNCLSRFCIRGISDSLTFLKGSDGNHGKLGVVRKLVKSTTQRSTFAGAHNLDDLYHVQPEVVESDQHGSGAMRICKHFRAEAEGCTAVGDIPLRFTEGCEYY